MTDIEKRWAELKKRAGLESADATPVKNEGQPEKSSVEERWDQIKQDMASSENGLDWRYRMYEQTQERERQRKTAMLQEKERQQEAERQRTQRERFEQSNRLADWGPFLPEPYQMPDQTKELLEPLEQFKNQQRYQTRSFADRDSVLQGKVYQSAAREAERAAAAGDVSLYSKNLQAIQKAAGNLEQNAREEEHRYLRDNPDVAYARRMSADEISGKLQEAARERAALEARRQEIWDERQEMRLRGEVVSIDSHGIAHYGPKDTELEQEDVEAARRMKELEEETKALQSALGIRKNEDTQKEYVLAAQQDSEYKSQASKGKNEFNSYIISSRNAEKQREDEGLIDKIGRYLSEGGGTADTSLPLGTMQASINAMRNGEKLPAYDVLNNSVNGLDSDLREMFYYWWAKDKDNALKYLDYANGVQRERKLQRVKEQAKEHPVLGTIAAAEMNLVSGADYLGALAEAAATGNIGEHQPDIYISEYRDAMHEGVSENFKTGLGRFAYQVGTSMLDSGAAMATGNTVPTFFLSAASSEYLEAKKRGASDEQALLSGTLSGLAECVFEEVSVEKLLSQDTSEKFLKAFMKQAFTEASEEVTTSLANSLSDLILSRAYGFETKVEARRRELMESGMSYEAANRQAKKEWFDGVLMDGLAGAVSGGGMTGLHFAGGKLVTSMQSRQYQNYLLDVENAGRSVAVSMSDVEARQALQEIAEQEKKARDAGNRLRAEQLKQYAKGVREELESREQGETDSSPLAQNDGTGDGGRPNSQESRSMTAPTETGQADALPLAQNDAGQEKAVQAAREMGYNTAVRAAETMDDKTIQASIRASEEGIAGARQEGDLETAAMHEGIIQGLREAFDQRMAQSDGLSFEGELRRSYDAENGGQAMLVPTENGGLNDGTAGDQGIAEGGQRDGGLGAGEQAGSLGTGTEGSVAGGESGTRINDLKNYVKALGAEKQSSREIGIIGGTKNASVIPVDVEALTGKLHDSLAGLQEKAARDGVRLDFVLGKMEVRQNGATTRSSGVFQVDRDGTPHVFIQADSLQRSPEQLYEHEMFHAFVARNKSLWQDIVNDLYENHTEEEIRTMVEAYVSAYQGCYGTEDADVDKYLEELFADVYAGMQRGDSRARKARDLAAPTAQRFAGDIENARQNRAGIERRNGPGVRLSAEEKQDQRHILAKLKAAIADISDMDIVASVSEESFAKDPNKQLTDQVEEFFDTLGNKVERENFGEVLLKYRRGDIKAGVASDIAHGIGRAKAATFAAVPDVIKHGKQIDYQENWKGNGYDTYAFAAPVNIGQRKAFMTVVVLRDRGTNAFYLHEVLDEDGNFIIIPQKTEDDTSPLHSRPADAGGDESSSNKRIPQTGNSVNPQEQNSIRSYDNTGRELSEGQQEYFKDSKAVDKDGNLLVLYRGKRGGETVIHGDYRGAIWTTTDPEFADRYGVKDELYANVTNPYYKTVYNTDSDTGYDIDVVIRDAKQGGHDGAIISFMLNPGVATGYVEYAAKNYPNEPASEILASWAKSAYMDAHEGETIGEFWKRANEGPVSQHVVVFSSEQIKRTDNLTPTEKPDIRFSPSEDDGEIDWIGNRNEDMSGKDQVYLQAVEEGRKDEAKWMVDEAAKEAGYTHKGFHQTGADFTSFSTKNEVAGQFDDETPTGIFIKPTDEDIGLTSGKKQMPLYFKADNMLEFADRAAIRDYWKKNVPGYAELAAQLQEKDEELKRQYDELDAEWFKLYEETYDSDDQSALDALDKRQDEFLEEWNKALQPLRRQMKNLVTAYMKESKYDGIHLKYDGKVYGGPKVETYIVFDPEQVRSAEPVTYDDQGNVIPLSERFRADRVGTEEWKNRDIRFSPSEDGGEIDWIGKAQEDEDGEDGASGRIEPSTALKGGPPPLDRGGLESGGRPVTASTEAEALAKEKKVEIAERASVEGLKSRITTAEERLKALKAAQKMGFQSKDVEKAVADVQETLRIFRSELERKKAARTAEKADEAKQAEKKAQRKAEKLAAQKEAELADNRPRQARKEFRQDALNLFSVQAGKRQALGNILNSFADKLLAKGSVSAEDRAELFRQLYEAGVEVVQAEDYYKNIRETVENARIYVPESVRAEFGDDWKAFRDAAWGNGVYLTNNQSDRGADSWNAELAELFPGAFDAAETDAKTMLENIVDLAREGKAEFVSLGEMMRRNQAETGATVDEQMDELERKMDQLIDTFAQKAELEVKTRKQGMMKLVKERQKNREMAARQVQRKRENDTRNQVMKQLQQLNKMRKRSAPEIQRQIDDIIGNLDTMARSISPEGLENLQALARKYSEAAEDPNFLGNPYVEARLARLSQVQLDDLEISDVIELGRTISALVKTVTEDKRLLTDERNREISEAAKDANREIASSAGSKGGKLREFFGSEHLSPTREIQRLGGWVRGGEMEQLSRALEDGGTRRMEYQRQATRIFDKFLSDKSNQKWLQKAQGKDADWISVTVPAGITAEDGSLKIQNVTLELTPMMRVGLLMHSRNVDNLRHIETGGIVIPNKEYYRKGDLANADAKGTRVKLRPEVVRGIVKDCTPQERAFAALLEQYYDGLSKEKINEVSMLIDGFERAGGDHYYGIKVSRKFLASAPEQVKRDMSLESIGSIVNERVHAGNPIILEDASTALKDHIDLISKYYGYTAAIRDFNAVMNYTFHQGAEEGGAVNAYAGSVKETLQDKWGAGAQKYLDELLADLQQSSGINETAAQFLAKLRGNLAGASLMFNPAVALSQTASLPGAAQSLGFDALIAGLKPQKVDMGLVEKYSPVLWYRNQGNSTQELGDYMSRQGLEGKLPFFFNWIQKMDSWTIRRLWAAAEYRVSKDTDLSPGSKEQIDAGTDPYYQEVARVFQRAVYDTQPNYSEMQRPDILRSKSDLTKMLTMYKTVPLQYYNMMYEAAGRLKADKARFEQEGSAENKANYAQSRRFAAKTFAGVLAANVVYVAMKALVKGLLAGKDDRFKDEEGELDAGKIFGGLGKDLVETYAGSVIFGSELLETMEKLYNAATTGSYSRYGGLEISALGAVEDTLGGLYNLAKELHDQDLTGGLGAIKDLAKQISMDLGVPANNIETYLLGTAKWFAPEWVDRYENFFDEFERADLKGEHGRELRAAIRVLMDNRTDGLKDETIDELTRLWATGQNAAIPSAIPSKVSVDGEDVEIKGSDRSAFRERWGQVVSGSLEQLLASAAYQDADDKGKASLIGKLYDYARQQAMAAVTGKEPSAWAAFGQACEAAGIPLVQYLAVASVDKSDLKEMDGTELESAIESRMEFRVGELGDKTLEELSRLYAGGGTGAIPSDVPTGVSVGGEEHKLTPDERVTWLQSWKRTVGEGLEDLMSSAPYKAADDAEKVKMIAALYDIARAGASAEVAAGYAPDKWISVGMEAENRGVPIDEYAAFHVGLSGLKTAEKLDLLKKQSWSNDQKEYLWKELMASDTQAAKYENLKNAGVTWADAMDRLGIGASTATSSGLTDEQQAQYDKYWNDISGPATQRLLNNTAYRQADKAAQAAYLDRLNDYAARSAKAKVLSGYDKGKWVECGERLTTAGVALDDYIVYCENTSDANNRAKYEALAKTKWTDAQKLIALEYVSASTCSAAKVGKNYEVPLNLYLEGLTKADADQSGNINQDEAEAWIDKSGIAWDLKAYLWQMLCYSSKWKNNPYSTTRGEEIWHSLHPDN